MKDNEFAIEPLTISIEMSLSEWQMIMSALIMATGRTGDSEYLGIRDVISRTIEEEVA